MEHEKDPVAVRSLTLYRVVVSVAIVTVLGIQALASIGKRPINWWPFLSYPMYRTARGVGDEIPTYALYGVLGDGREIRLESEDFGLNFQKFRSGLIHAIRNADLERVLRYAEIYRARNPDSSLAGFRVDQRAAVWDGDAVAWTPARTIARVEFAS